MVPLESLLVSEILHVKHRHMVGLDDSISMFVGLDVDKNYVQAAVVDGEGMLLREQKIPNDVREIERFFAGIADAKIVIASSGPLVRAQTQIDPFS